MKRLLLAGILFLALALRLTGAGFGLPDLYHADEPIVVNHALAYGAGDLNPHFFKIPPLVSYLLFTVYGIFFLAGHLLGRFPTAGHFEQAFYADPSAFYLIARLFFGVFAGTLTVYVSYRWILRSFRHAATAFLGAFFLSVCFLHVRDSHYVYADIPLVLVLVLAFGSFFQMDSADRSSWKQHALAGLWTGIAAAVKYNGAALFIPYAILSWRNSGKNRLIPNLGIFAVSAAAVFFLLNPFSVLDRSVFLRELQVQSRSNTGVPWIHHLVYSLRGALGIPLLFAAGGGMVRCFLKPDIQRVSVLVFILSYYGILILAGQPYDRYVLPIIPFLLFFAADFFILLKAYFPALGKKGIALIAFLAALPTFASSVLCDRILLAPDTRTLARQWIEANIPSPSSTALAWDFYMPRLAFSKDQLLEKKTEVEKSGPFKDARLRKLDSLMLNSRRPGYMLYFLSDAPNEERFLFAKPNLPYDLNVLKGAGVQYVVWARLQDQHADFYRQLQKEGELLARFSPYHDPSRLSAYDPLPLTGAPFQFQELWNRARNGQILEIYRLR